MALAATGDLSAAHQYAQAYGLSMDAIDLSAEALAADTEKCLFSANLCVDVLFSSHVQPFAFVGGQHSDVAAHVEKKCACTFGCLSSHYCNTANGELAGLIGTRTFLRTPVC